MNYPRSDEDVIESTRSRNEGQKKLIKKGATLAAGAATGAIGSRIAPFLSEHIPIDLALKGINKVAPSVGEFLKKGKEAGLDINEGMEFIKSKISPKEEKAPRNIIEKYSPELFEFIKEQIRRGQRPMGAAVKAIQDSEFKKIIMQIERENDVDFAQLLNELFGNKAAQEQPPEQPSSGSAQAAPQQAGNPQDAAIMAALQKILNM